MLSQRNFRFKFERNSLKLLGLMWVMKIVVPNNLVPMVFALGERNTLGTRLGSEKLRIPAQSQLKKDALVWSAFCLAFLKCSLTTHLRTGNVQ
jgi:hypothetical protein